MSRLAAGVVLLGLVGMASPALWADHNQVYELHQRGEIVSLVDIIHQAQAIRPGQMVEAELDEQSLVYEITIYGEDDRYHELYFDARDGRLITTHADDEPDADDRPLDELSD